VNLILSESRSQSASRGHGVWQIPCVDPADVYPLARCLTSRTKAAACGPSFHWPAHRSLAIRAWLRCQRYWLVVEPLPGYAPELNPVEALWSNLKGVELANLAGDTLAEVIAVGCRTRFCAAAACPSDDQPCRRN
jgi:hypothetical protein